ncbi:hypothetical protein SEVIR_2G286001v4 [Setaria viridis]
MMMMSASTDRSYAFLRSRLLRRLLKAAPSPARRSCSPVPPHGAGSFVRRHLSWLRLRLNNNLLPLQLLPLSISLLPRPELLARDGDNTERSERKVEGAMGRGAEER